MPSLKARDVLRALQSAGFSIVRTSGSHYRLVHDTDASRQATISTHKGRDLARGTLRAIIDQAGLTVDEFTDLL